MAHDDRYERRPGWRGDENAFGGGWGNQTPHGRPQRLGDRGWRGESDDPDYGLERYGPGPAEGYGGEYSLTSDPDPIFSAPGYDPGFGGPRFDRLDVGSVGTHGVHPVSSAFGGGRGAMGISPEGGYRSSARRYAEQGRGGHGDRHYSEWRRRRIEELDRDYDDYCRERQSSFERDFGAWRERRGEQRRALGRVNEHMEVVGSDGRHVGTVDCTSGDRIVLTRSDPDAEGHHHSIPCSWVEEVGDKVRLNIDAEEAQRRWRDEARSRALFERPDSGEGGPHVLNRSFAGTYPDDE